MASALFPSYLVFSPAVSPPWLPWFSPRNHPCEMGCHMVPYPPFISYLVLHNGVRCVPIMTSYLVFSPAVSPPWLPWFYPGNHPFQKGATWRLLCASYLHVLPGATTWRPLCSRPSTLPRIFSSCLSSLAALVLSKKSSLWEGRNMVSPLVTPLPNEELKMSGELTKRKTTFKILH